MLSPLHLWLCLQEAFREYQTPIRRHACFHLSVIGIIHLTQLQYFFKQIHPSLNFPSSHCKISTNHITISRMSLFPNVLHTWMMTLKNHHPLQQANRKANSFSSIWCVAQESLLQICHPYLVWYRLVLLDSRY